MAALYSKWRLVLGGDMKRKYLIIAIIGFLITLFMHELATIKRGYDAYGGELFILPLMIAISTLKVETKKLFKNEEGINWRKTERASSTARY